MDSLHLYDYVPHGMDNQTLEVTLKPGQSIHAENGAMSFMEDGITMSTGTGPSRGPLALFKRRISGETILINVFTNETDVPKHLGINPREPAHILPVELDASTPDLICRQGGFLAGHPDVRVTVAVAPAKAAVFGKSDLIMQRLHGLGQAFLTGNGAVIRKELGPGETYLADTAVLVAFEDTVDYTAQLPRGLSNIMWSKENLFLLSIQGPGTVWFQSASKPPSPTKKVQPR